MQLSTKSIVIFVAAVLAASLLADLYMSKDPALPGAKEFVAASPEVSAVVGYAESIKVHRLVSYHGVPGKEEPYRQYQLTVVGSKGSANATVRAIRSATENSWNYKLMSVSR